MKTMIRLAAALVLFTGLSVPGVDAQEKTGYVMRVEGRLVFLDLGAQNEVIPNDLFRVFRQETIIHPVTGENLGGEVPLGVVKIVEIFPRYSTAEILKLDPGTDIRMMEADARQGLVRVKMLTSEEEMDLQNTVTRSPLVRAPTVAAPSTGNPDGEMRSIVLEIRIGGGSPVETNLPDRAYKLVADPTLQALMDTTGVSELDNFNSSLLAEAGIRMPLNDKVSFVGSIGLGAATKIALGGKYYPGSLFGSGLPTPSGHVGEPSIKLTVGYGGRGSSSLPSDALTQLTATSPAPVGFQTTIDDSLLTVPVTDATLEARIDSVYQATFTDSIRTVANDSLSELASSGLGFGIGIELPVTEQFKLDASMDRFGSIEEFSFGLTWYQKRLVSGETNPDGVLKSLIARARMIMDTHVSKNYVDLGLTYPVTKQYTISAGFVSDFSGFSQFGLAVRAYINR